MKRFIIVGIVIFIVVAYLVTYRVRFTETAVKTTFSKASSEPDDTPGLKFLIPYVQNVVKYDKRARYLESKPETIQTRDARQLVITAYVTWQVTDPKLFYQSFIGHGERASNHYRGAERILSEKLRAAMGEVSKFRFDELLSTSAAGSQLEACEQRILAHLDGFDPDRPGESLAAKYGIKPVSVGIIGMELPEETTAKVFDAMQANRGRIANDAVSQGKAIAETIRNTAAQDAKTILEFAERRAQRIRAEGEREAQIFQRELDKQPELAVFIRNMELMKEVFGNNRATVFIPTGPKGWPGFQLFQPSLLNGLKTGQIPSFDQELVPKVKASEPAQVKPAPAVPEKAPKTTASAKGIDE